MDCKKAVHLFDITTIHSFQNPLQSQGVILRGKCFLFRVSYCYYFAIMEKRRTKYVMTKYKDSFHNTSYIPGAGVTNFLSSFWRAARLNIRQSFIIPWLLKMSRLFLLQTCIEVFLLRHLECTRLVLEEICILSFFGSILL